MQRIEELSRQLDEFRDTKQLLEQRLKQEIQDKEVSLEMADRGLIISFIADVLFDSGQAKIKREAISTLDKVVRILIENVPGNDIGIEGHTDNLPIKTHEFPSNWQLSATRAANVVHFLTTRTGVPENQISAAAYADQRPVAPNETEVGRQRNRRVDIVFLKGRWKSPERTSQTFSENLSSKRQSGNN